MTDSPNRVLALAFGALFAALGLLGFTATMSDGAFAPTGGLLLGIIGVNATQNILHLLVGATLIAAALVSTPVARRVNPIVGTVLLVLGITGLFVIGGPSNFIAVNGAANTLHFGSAAVLLAVGLGASETPRTAAAHPR